MRDTKITMESRKCFIPTCKNDSINSPGKIFVRIREDLREKWCREANVEYFKVYTQYCCEDHFAPKVDLGNYYRYKLMNEEPRLKPTASLRNITLDTSTDSIELNKLLVQHPITQKPIKRKYEDLLNLPSTSAYSTLPMKVSFTASGLMPPVFTPLNDDLTVNYGVIPAYAKFLADNGIKSVLVGGTTGENMSLSVAERKKLVDAWVAVGKTNRLHIQVQVGGAPLADVTVLAAYCQSAGADSLLTLPELYFRPQTVDELVSYVEIVSKAAPKLPILYYHIPSMSKVEINMPAFVKAATARIPSFKGIKFTSNDLSEGAQVLRALENGQEMFLGADTLLAPAALLGVRSSIGTLYNLFPRLAQDILDAVAQSDVTKARALQEKLSLAIEAHTSEGSWVPIMKAGMEIVTGIKVGPPSLPQKEISAEAKKRIQGRLRSLGLAK